NRVRLAEPLDPTGKRHRCPGAVYAVAPGRDGEVDGPRPERLDPNTIDGDARLDVIGGATESNDGAIRVAVEAVVRELIGCDVDHPRQMQRAAPRAPPASDLEQVGEVRFVPKDERHHEGAGVVVGQLDTLDQ